MQDEHQNADPQGDPVTVTLQARRHRGRKVTRRALVSTLPVNGARSGWSASAAARAPCGSVGRRLPLPFSGSHTVSCGRESVSRPGEAQVLVPRCARLCRLFLSQFQVTPLANSFPTEQSEYVVSTLWEAESRS